MSDSVISAIDSVAPGQDHPRTYIDPLTLSRLCLRVPVLLSIGAAHKLVALGIGILFALVVLSHDAAHSVGSDGSQKGKGGQPFLKLLSKDSNEKSVKALCRFRSKPNS